MQIKHLKGEIKIKNKLIKQLENYNIEKFDIKNDLIKIKKEKIYKKYENLIIEGGGTKGICYCGALQELEKMGILEKLIRYAGSSAGAITVSLLAIGYNAKEVKDIIYSTDFEKFIDDDFGIIRDIYSIMNDYGYCSGKFFFNFIGNLIKEKTGNQDYSFKNLWDDKKKELVITGTDLNAMKTIYYCNKNTPNMPIRDAVRISMSIPFLFTPLKWNECFMIDGGTIDNYPLHVFDGAYPGDPVAKLNLAEANSKTIGLKIMTPKEQENYDLYPPEKINSLKQFCMSIFNTLMTANERKYLKPGYWERTIPIKCPNIPITNFNIKDEMKKKLIQNGKEAVKKYFGDLIVIKKPLQKKEEVSVEKEVPLEKKVVEDLEDID